MLNRAAGPGWGVAASSLTMFLKFDHCSSGAHSAQAVPPPPGCDRDETGSGRPPVARPGPRPAGGAARLIAQSLYGV
jgi:hypothetical protein